MKVIGNNLRKKANYVHMTWKNLFFYFFAFYSYSFMGSEITQISILLQICGLISKKRTATYEKLSFYANAFQWNRLYLFKSFDHATNAWSMQVATQCNIYWSSFFSVVKSLFNKRIIWICVRINRKKTQFMFL